MWCIFPSFLSGLFCVCQEGYKLFKDIMYAIIPVQGGFLLPFCVFRAALIHPVDWSVDWFFSAASQQLHTESGPEYPIHFKKLFHAFCATQISVILYYLCGCHFYKTSHSLYFCQNRDTIQISSANTLGHPWRSWEAVYGAIHTGLGRSLGFRILPLLPWLCRFLQSHNQERQNRAEKYGKKRNCLSRYYFLFQGAI